VREALDIDSFDYTRYLVLLSEAVGTDIPASDAARLCTLESSVAYLSTRAAHP
jgi:acyl carrier protein